MTAMSAGDLLNAGQPVSPILGFYRHDDSRKVIAAAFERPGLGELMLSEGGLDVALKVMRRGEKPGLLVYDVTGSSNPVADIETLIKHGGRSMPIIAVGGTIEIGRFREFLAAGVFDYLDRALGEGALADAVAKARRQRTRRATDMGPARSGKVVAFCGSRGGAGTTTLAIATAWTLAYRDDTNTALVDLDLMFGTTAFALDIDPGRGLREGLEQPARIDSVFLERSLVREGAKLAILSSEEPVDDGVEIDPGAGTALLDELKQSFDCIIVDLPRGLAPITKTVLAAANDIVLVTTPSLAGLRDAIRWLEYFAMVADRAVVRVVQGPAPANAALPQAEFEKSLGRKIDLVIPFDAATAAAAANAGKAIPDLAPQSPVSGAVAELTGLLGFSATTPVTPGGFRWPWRRRHEHP
jgi:pilus assembly protein CpaE